MSSLSKEEVVSRFLNGDIRTLSRYISAAENRDPELLTVLSKLFEKGGRANVVGFTGPPGSGKSSLIDQWVSHLRLQKRTVAVIGIDPTSAISGGALLGDRLRWIQHFNDTGVYLRSLATRGQLGGLSMASFQTIDLLDAFGFSDIVVETVGVGQNEIEVRHLVDFVSVVLVPESGDDIQAIKAGLMEIGDLYILNKTDRSGGEKLESEIRALGKNVVKTSIQNPSSLNELWKILQQSIDKKGSAKRRSKMQTKFLFEKLVSQRALDEAETWSEVRTGLDNPYHAYLEFSKGENQRKKLEKR